MHSLSWRILGKKQMYHVIKLAMHSTMATLTWKYQNMKTVLSFMKCLLCRKVLCLSYWENFKDPTQVFLHVTPFAIESHCCLSNRLHIRMQTPKKCQYRQFMALSLGCSFISCLLDIQKQFEIFLLSHFPIIVIALVSFVLVQLFMGLWWTALLK